MSVCQKIIGGNTQPNGGNGIVSIAGARALGMDNNLLTQVANTNIVSPFPPYLGSQLDQSVAVINNKLDTRFDDTNYYNGSGVAS